MREELIEVEKEIIELFAYFLEDRGLKLKNPEKFKGRISNIVEDYIGNNDVVFRDNLASLEGEIIELLEDYLDKKKIILENPEKDEDGDEFAANIYGSDYGELQTGLDMILENHGIVEM